MEVASYYYCPTKTKAHPFCSSLLTSKPKFCSIPSQPIPRQQLSFWRRRPPNKGSLTAAILGCTGTGKGGPEVDRELEEEMRKSIFSGEEGMEGKWIGKCEEGGGGGIVELMECLEREAIMGEDEGREPHDYNRRAIMFDTSSRVFQAFKDKHAHK